MVFVCSRVAFIGERYLFEEIQYTRLQCHILHVFIDLGKILCFFQIVELHNKHYVESCCKEREILQVCTLLLVQCIMQLYFISKLHLLNSSTLSVAVIISTYNIIIAGFLNNISRYPPPLRHDVAHGDTKACTCHYLDAIFHNTPIMATSSECDDNPEQRSASCSLKMCAKAMSATASKEKKNAAEK